ncbi:MAG: hypothetical protein QXD77_01550 [Candidatus Aenigmatarchaeota archaeon]
MDDWMTYAVDAVGALASGIVAALTAHRLDKYYVERVREMENKYLSCPPGTYLVINMDTLYLERPVRREMKRYEGHAALDYVEEELEEMKPSGPWGMLVRRRVRKKIADARRLMAEPTPEGLEKYRQERGNIRFGAV